MVLTVSSLFISLCTAGTLVYGFGKFLAKPHDTLEQRVSLLERHNQEFIRMLEKINRENHEQDDTNEVLIHSVMALIEFEIQYCITEKKPISHDLEQAKSDLHRYLAKK